MIRKILHSVLALTLAAGMALATVHDAQAGHGGRVAAGIAAGIIGLGLLGAAASARDRYDYDDDYDEARCHRGRLRCHWEGGRCFENRYGETVCRGGERVCHRPLICD